MQLILIILSYKNVLRKDYVLPTQRRKPLSVLKLERIQLRKRNLNIISMAKDNATERRCLILLLMLNILPL